jgi:hypothetical protein
MVRNNRQWLFPLALIGQTYQKWPSQKGAIRVVCEGEAA